MTDEQKAASVAAIAAAVRHFHTQALVAAQIGKSTSHVSRLVAGDVVIDAVDAVTLDKRSGGKIARHELRPDLWEKPRRSRFNTAPAKMLATKKLGEAAIAAHFRGFIADGGLPGHLTDSTVLTVERIPDRRDERASSGVLNVSALVDKARARRANPPAIGADVKPPAWPAKLQKGKANGKTRTGQHRKGQGEGQKQEQGREQRRPAQAHRRQGQKAGERKRRGKAHEG